MIKKILRFIISCLSIPGYPFTVVLIWLSTDKSFVESIKFGWKSIWFKF